MTSSTHSTGRIGQRLVKALTIALAASALTVATPALAGWPDSEKTAGLWPTAEPSAPIVSEKITDGAGFGPGAEAKPTVVPKADDKLFVGTPAATLHPDSRALRPGPYGAAGEPSEFANPRAMPQDGLRPIHVMAESDRGIDWSDAGIGAALALASMLGAAAVLTIRRHHGPLAH